MFKLGTSLGLTQAGLARLLGGSRRAVAEWEGGSNYPKADHLQHVLELCVQQQVFAPGGEEEEIRAVWKTAHQRVLLVSQNMCYDRGGIVEVGWNRFA